MVASGRLDCHVSADEMGASHSVMLSPVAVAWQGWQSTREVPGGLGERLSARGEDGDSCGVLRRA